MTLPLAFLHGFTGSPDSLAPTIRAFSDTTIRVVTPWLCGHAPDGSPRVETFEEEVDRIAALLRADAARWHLAGYSLGGRVAIGLLARHASLFSTATLIGAQPGLGTEQQRAARRAADERLCRLLESEGVEAFVSAWEALPLFSTQKELSADVLAGQRASRLARNARGLCRSLRATGLGAMPDYAAALERLDVPVTWIAGARDEKFSTIAREMAARMPHGSVRLFGGAGHNVLLENPSAVAHTLENAVKTGA